MLKYTTHFEQVPLLFVEKLMKSVAENIPVAPKKSKRKALRIIAAQQIQGEKGAKR